MQQFSEIKFLIIITYEWNVFCFEKNVLNIYMPINANVFIQEERQYFFLFVIKEKNTSHYYFLVSWKKPSKKKHDGFSLPQKTTVIMSIV